MISFVHKRLRANKLQNPFQLPLWREEPDLNLIMKVEKEKESKSSADSIPKIQVYNKDVSDFFRNHVKNETVDLVICDPPYWKVAKESWDYQWRTEDDYVEWCKEWLTLIYSSLRLSGSFYLFGYLRMLVLVHEFILSLGFDFRQQIIIDKGIKSVTGRATKGYKMFPNVTESVFFYVKNAKPFIKDFLKQRAADLGLSAKEINTRLGVKINGGGVWSLYTGENILAQVPTEEMWGRLSKVLEFDLQYGKIGQTFNIELGFTDVWTDIDFYEEKRIHPTQKPVSLISRLINASSNEGDLICDPFAGSGSTAVCCQMSKRRFTGTEIDVNYFNDIQKRLKQPKQSNLLV
jgi:adenine-specific DNA-methyltransferase